MLGQSARPALQVTGVGKTFTGGTVAVQENDFITILGPSGCGKSTLLRMVAGLDTPTGGRIELDGRTVYEVQRAAGLLPAA